MRQERITIVGGGLVGALLATMLGRRGYQVTVFEKRPDMRKTEVAAGRSINLALAERGLKALRRAELDDDVEPLLIPMRGRMLHPLGGELEFSPYGQLEHEVIYSVSRGILNERMLTASEESKNVTFYFDHECTGVDLDGKTIQLMNHQTGERRSHDFEILLGTDGANSAVRDAVVNCAGGTWTTDWLDHDYKELNIPPGPDGSFQIDKNSLHIWPRHGYMLIALPNLDGSFTVTLFLQKEGDPSFSKLTDEAAVESFFLEQFPDAHALLPDLKQDFFHNPTGVLGTVRCTRWTDGQSACLLGDAAHAIVPFHGQGMNAGFEDCAVLMDLLDESHRDWGSAMTAFEERRIDNANAIADMALENYITMRDSVLDPVFQLKKQLGFELERRFPDRFIPRYSMVMFHSIPYADAKHRGEIQDQILELLIGTSSTIDEIDFEFAGRLITERLSVLDEVNA
ncbi:MAG: NAD(P)/FAD-dependent oxidoreductase [Pirellulaceae bacterium]